jgi:UDP-2,3-diacylglucosamine pyrophosphatase LpxH
MYIFMSDFHLMDGTAGGHYVEPGVFASTLTDLAGHAREADATEITLVFLGDIIDLYKSERWFDYPLEARPWGSTPSDEALAAIFEGIITSNAQTFELLSGSLTDQFGFPVEPKRLYIPGNHDRLVNFHPNLRRRLREVLGMEAGDDPFPYHVLDEEHGVFARHGHEWDPVNFEGSKALDSGEYLAPPEDYVPMPVGDAMACELASKIPLLVAENLGDNPTGARVAERMRDIVDVRPLVGMVRWASWQVNQFDETERDAIHRALSDAARSTRDVPFVQEWLEKHDEFGPDAADRVQAVLRLLSSLELLKHETFLSTLDLAGQLGTEDRFALSAGADFARLDRYPEIGKNIYYVLYGHTHAARQLPVQVIGTPPRERYRVYFNTGTWRPVHRLLLSGDGFASWKDLTYVLVYRPGETVSGGTFMPYPAAESWTGTVIVGRGRRTTATTRIPKTMLDEVG